MCLGGYCVKKTVPCDDYCSKDTDCEHTARCKEGKCVTYVGNGHICDDCFKCSHGFVCSGHYPSKCIPEDYHR
jgi:hypothetical protein